MNETMSSPLQGVIRSEIESQGQPISFQRYMELALYAPGLGYYQRPQMQLGKGGDFTTAPEISPYFGQAIARQLLEILPTLSEPCLIEYGAGSGQLAVQILSYLAEHGWHPRYLIIELSASLKALQAETIGAKTPPLLSQVTWLSTLPEGPCEAIVIANEVLDAMPVARFHYESGQLHEVMIDAVAGELQPALRPPSDALVAATEELLPLFSTVPYYASEVNLFISPWIKSISDYLQKGVVLLIDYGFDRQTYYHPDRNQGTLICHHQHRAHPDPLVAIGEQDITAHVDFTAVADSAVAAGFDVRGYTSQGYFLLNCGLLSLIPPGDIEAATQVKILTLPQEMGELFKVMALTKGWDEPLQGFAQGDRRMSL